MITKYFKLIIRFCIKKGKAMEFIIEETPMDKICINPNQCLNSINEVNAICSLDYCFDCGCLGDCGSFSFYR